MTYTKIFHIRNKHNPDIHRLVSFEKMIGNVLVLRMMQTNSLYYTSLNNIEGLTWVPGPLAVLNWNLNEKV